MGSSMDAGGSPVRGEARSADEFATVTLRIARALGIPDHKIAATCVEHNPRRSAAFDLEQIKHSGAVKFSARAVNAAMLRQLSHH